MELNRSNVIVNAVVGSTAYGMATPTSDKDELGIYVARMNDVLGLSTAQVVTDSKHDTDPDYTLHEVGKYMELALKCNPSILELLWLDHYLVMTSVGSLLVRNRDIFLHTPAVRGAYGSYAKQQADRLIQRHADGKDGFSSSVKNRTAKHARHCMRLLFQGSQLLAKGTMDVRVDQDTRAELFYAGEVAENDPTRFYVHHYQPAMETFDAIESVLPDKPDRHAANNLLIQIRRLAEFYEDAGYVNTNYKIPEHVWR
jgi:predicted nucleotidyltransferase